MSHLAVSNGNSPIDGKQSAGLAVLGMNETSQAVTLNDFFGLDITGTGASGTVNSVYSMQDAYGYTTTADVETFVYASKLEAKLVIPRATLTGTYYKGTLRLSQLYDNLLTTQSPAISLASLIRAADKVEGMQPGFSLHSAIVNDYILTHTLKTGEDVLVEYLKDNDLGAEVIDYIILQSPAVNISSGVDQVYSMI